MLTKATNTVIAVAFSCAAAWAQAPLSAIDWLSEALVDTTSTPFSEGPWAEWSLTESSRQREVIRIAPITSVTPDSAGLLSADATGLPRNLWGAASSSEIAILLEKTSYGLLPSMRRLLFVLLLAETDPPTDGDDDGLLFLARIDLLLNLGAVDQAQALLELAGADDTERFRRWFDVSLLTGTERNACARLLRTPGLLDSLSARVFCLVRKGDYDAAALTLETARSLGTIDEPDAELLTRFLTPEMDDFASPVQPPRYPSPLTFRIHEAIGEPLPTLMLPRAFAQADLRSNIGWKAQIEAAERLAQTGAVSANLLLGLYTKRKPAASGGVWDRSAAIQNLDAAIREREPDRIAKALPEAWQVMRHLGLEAILAELYAEDLRELELEAPAKALAYRIRLLSKDYRAVAMEHIPVDADERFLQAVARGDPAAVAVPNDLAFAIAEGFRVPSELYGLSDLTGHRTLGVAVLYAVMRMRDGGMGDLGGIVEAIALFRAVGLENVARRAALETMILDRRT